MSALQARLSYGQLGVLSVGCVSILLLLAHLTWAEEPATSETTTEKSRDLAVASDQSAEEIAKEILRLQQDLGGSVVPRFQGHVEVNEPPHWHSPDGPLGKALITDDEEPSWTAYPPLSVPTSLLIAKKVDELREAAFGLETTAHRLEKLELYDQADALRHLAVRLRTDARQMKQHSESAIIKTSGQHDLLPEKRDSGDAG